MRWARAQGWDLRVARGDDDHGGRGQRSLTRHTVADAIAAGPAAARGPPQRPGQGALADGRGGAAGCTALGRRAANLRRLGPSHGKCDAGAASAGGRVRARHQRRAGSAVCAPLWLCVAVSAPAGSPSYACALLPAAMADPLTIGLTPARPSARRIVRVTASEAPTLGAVLAKLERRELLWTPSGLRSLAQNSSLYGRRNTEVGVLSAARTTLARPCAANHVGSASRLLCAPRAARPTLLARADLDQHELFGGARAVPVQRARRPLPAGTTPDPKRCSQKDGGRPACPGAAAVLRSGAARTGERARAGTRRPPKLSIKASATTSSATSTASTVARTSSRAVGWRE